MSVIFSWVFAWAVAVAYTLGALYLRGRVIERVAGRLRTSPSTRDELALTLLHAPSLILIYLLAAGLLVVCLPLSQGGSALAASGLRIAFLIGLVYVGRVLLIFWADHAGAHSAIANRTFRRALHASLYSFGTLLVLSLIGVPVVPLIALIGIVIAVVALSLRDAVSNLVAGFYFSLHRPIEIGDYIKVDGVGEGVVNEIEWFNTLLSTRNGPMIVIPNRQLMAAPIRNFGASDVVTPTEFRVMISPEVMLERAAKSTLQAAETVLEEAAELVGSDMPQIYFESISGAGTEIRIILHARDRAAIEALRHAFWIALHKRFKNDRITLAGEPEPPPKPPRQPKQS